MGEPDAIQFERAAIWTAVGGPDGGIGLEVDCILASDTAATVLVGSFLDVATISS
jgi:hypothetical protein